MTVNELITHLSLQPPGLEVKFATESGGKPLEILSIYSDEGLYPSKKKAKTLWIDLG